jgi:hypothetical protein
MKRAFTITVLALVAVIAAFAYLHHHRVAKERQEFDAFSPPVASHATPTNSLPTAANAPSLVQQLPANASAVVFADVAALRSSSFANELASLAPTSVQDPAYTQFVQQTGFDYSRDLDRAALALWPQTNSTSALALARGRFDQAKIAHYALRNGGHLVTIRNQKVYEVREENSSRLVRFTFLAPDEIALADGPALSQVLGPQNSVRLDPQMSALVSRVSGAPIYAVARTQDLPKDLGIDTSHSAQLASMLRTIHTVFASGRPSADDLKLFASADCESTIDALKLSTTLQGLLWMGRAALSDSRTQQQIGPQWPGFDSMLKAADISHDGHLLQLRIQLTPQMLQAVMTPPPNAGAGK